MLDNKNQLLNVAREALQKNGVNGFSFRQLADEVGIKSSTVHYYFKNKTALFEQLSHDYRVDFLDRLSVIQQQAKSIQTVLDDLVQLFESVLKDDKFCLCGMMASDRKHLEQSIIRELQHYFMDVELWLSEIYTHYGHHPSVEVDALAKMTMAALEGALLLDGVTEQNQHLAATRQILTVLTTV